MENVLNIGSGYQNLGHGIFASLGFCFAAIGFWACWLKLRTWLMFKRARGTVVGYVKSPEATAHQVVEYLAGDGRRRYFIDLSHSAFLAPQEQVTILVNRLNSMEAMSDSQGSMQAGLVFLAIASAIQIPMMQAFHWEWSRLPWMSIGIGPAIVTSIFVFLFIAKWVREKRPTGKNADTAAKRDPTLSGFGTFPIYTEEEKSQIAWADPEFQRALADKLSARRFTNSDLRRRVLVVPLFVSLCFIVSVIFISWKKLQLLIDQESAVGIVLSHGPNHKARELNSYEYVLQFHASDARPVRARDTVLKKLPEVEAGTRVPILYQRAIPENAVIDRGLFTWFNPVLAIIFAIGLLVLFAALKGKGKTRR